MMPRTSPLHSSPPDWPRRGEAQATQSFGLGAAFALIAIHSYFLGGIVKLQNLDGSSRAVDAKLPLVQSCEFEGLSMGVMLNGGDRHVSVCLVAGFYSRNIDSALAKRCS
jgi:hypothetical protein